MKLAGGAGSAEPCREHCQGQEGERQRGGRLESKETSPGGAAASREGQEVLRGWAFLQRMSQEFQELLLSGGVRRAG